MSFIYMYLDKNINRLYFVFIYFPDVYFIAEMKIDKSIVAWQLNKRGTRTQEI
jgi:hypothetical protein